MEGARPSATRQSPPGARSDAPAGQIHFPILEMRGSPHVTEKRKLIIQQGGLTVESFPPAAR